MGKEQRASLLIELHTEELPPGSLRRLARGFFEQLGTRIKAAGLDFEENASRWYATPRRLAVLLADLAARQADHQQERRGPALSAAFDARGKPTKAAQGFARANATTVDALQRLETDKGAYLVYRDVVPGKSVHALLPDMARSALAQLPVAKPMRWGASEFEFVRPVHGVVALYGDELIEMSLFGIQARRESTGHRFHHPEPVSLALATDYEAALEKAFVIADFDRRRALIREQVARLAAHGKAGSSDALLDEVTALTEWPVAIACDFDARFLELPPEVIVTTLEHHQRFFPVLDASGNPTRHFIAVANLASKEPDVVRSGFERVVRPRLADAAFFYEQDRKTPLAERRSALKGMLFQQQLGSLFDKSERVTALCRAIASTLEVDKPAIERAAELSKCDLTTRMVGEFPELQGTMGRYYAQHDGETQGVAQAIAEHYRPRFSGDAIPASEAGRIVALADKLDTVCTVVRAAGKPTGNKDPFGLRRSALGIVRILIEGELDLDLALLIQQANAPITVPRESGDGDKETLGFFMERLRGYYREQGVPVDVFEAVRATGTTRLLDFHRRLRACLVFRAKPEAASLAAANKRVRNILKKADGGYPENTNPALLEEQAEKALHSALSDKADLIRPLLAQTDYQQALTELAGLREPVDAFFDEVLVMADDDDLRGNRLALLAAMNAMFMSIADISRLDLEEAT